MVEHEVLTENPPNAGVPVGALTGDSLSQDHMYVRCNFPVPDEAPGGFDIVVPGSETRFVTADSLASLPGVELDMVLECAGNGRVLMSPVPEGTPWGLGGASPIRVGGVCLIDVLGELPDEVSEVVFTGADVGTVAPEGKVPFQFSISRELAGSAVPILATHIGGEPLTLLHGAPIRLIVPGQYGMKSVKWLTRVEAVAAPFRGHFVEKYRYYGESAVPEGAPVGEIAVRSVISSPSDSATVPVGSLEIRGSAWAGMSEVTDVAVSTDGGDTWGRADLKPRESEGNWAPVRWSFTTEAETGSLVIIARAGDQDGAVQPLEPRWNANGYANNVVHRVRVSVAEPEA